MTARSERALFALFFLVAILLFNVYRFHTCIVVPDYYYYYNHNEGKSLLDFATGSVETPQIFRGVPSWTIVGQSQERQEQAEQDDDDNDEDDQEEEEESDDKVDVEHRVAGLSCAAFGGPADEVASEMVYWRDIPSDASYKSPYYQKGEERYLTFEPDEGGFNNIRMAMEVAVTLAVSMGRTLVLPPSQKMYLLEKGHSNSKQLGFQDFYHFDSVKREHLSSGGGFKVISFQQFLEKEAMTGNMVDMETGQVTFPPENRTDWNGLLKNYAMTEGHGKDLWGWMRRSTTPFNISDDFCMIAFPEKLGDSNTTANRMKGYLQEVLKQDMERFPNAPLEQRWRRRASSLAGHPVPVNASTALRLSEAIANRVNLCVYGQEMHEAKVIHVKGEERSGHRVLEPFYTFLFFENWHHDLWTKRFVRDHLRYKDEIQCAAARVVEAVRKDSRQHGDPNGAYDSFHIRRGDFQYLETRLSAEEIYYNNSRNMLKDGRTVFIATDERDMSFFDPLREHYNVKFLNDYMHLLEGVNPNYYGMIDQLIASRGDTFVGVYFSTFTAFINRMRGYHGQKSKAYGYEHGVLDSYQYMPNKLAHLRRVMRTYKSIEPPYWAQEFPAGWREIDFDVEYKIVSR